MAARVEVVGRGCVEEVTGEMLAGDGERGRREGRRCRCRAGGVCVQQAGVWAVASYPARFHFSISV